MCGQTIRARRFFSCETSVADVCQMGEYIRLRWFLADGNNRTELVEKTQNHTGSPRQHSDATLFEIVEVLLEQHYAVRPADEESNRS